MNLKKSQERTVARKEEHSKLAPESKPTPWVKRLWRWMGFGEKTGWQWLELLSVLALPVILALAGFYFTGRLDVRQQEIEAQRAESERELEEQRSQGAALQAYLDEMGNLMINRHLQDSNQDDIVFVLAQARTTTVVGRLDAEKNNSVMRFLADSGLIGDASSSKSLLEGADLHDADLAGVDLEGAALNGAKLSSANLSNADLERAEMQGANLEGANLSDVNLAHANLQDVNLKRADLTNADLRNADLTSADLSGAKGLNEAFLMDAILEGAFLAFVDLSHSSLWGADLTGADLSNANLTSAYLQGTDLANADLTDANLADAAGTNEGQLDATLSLANVIMPGELERANRSERVANRSVSAVHLAVDKYYWAVDREVWSYTYDNLDSETRSLFTKREWSQKNEWYADNTPARLSSLDVEIRLRNESTRADVTVFRRFELYERSAPQKRPTVFVYEDGSWKHHFVDGERKLFMPDATFEEFKSAKVAEQ